MSTSARVNAATCAVMTAAGSYGARSNVTVRLSPPPPAAASASAGSGRRTTRGAPSGPIVTSNDIDDPSVIAAIDSGVMPAACAAAIAAAASPPPPISFKMPPTMALICAPPSADVGSDTLPSCTLLPAGMRMKSPAAAARCVAAAWSMSSLRASPTTSGGRETRRSVSPSSTRRSDSRCVSLRTRPRQMRRWRADGTPHAVSIEDFSVVTSTWGGRRAAGVLRGAAGTGGAGQIASAKVVRRRRLRRWKEMDGKRSDARTRGRTSLGTVRACCPSGSCCRTRMRISLGSGGDVAASAIASVRRVDSRSTAAGATSREGARKASGRRGDYRGESRCDAARALASRARRVRDAAPFGDALARSISRAEGSSDA